jgi:hypothetical protein
MEDILYSLIKYSLWGTAIKDISSFQACDFDRLMALAERQTVVGMVADALIRNNVKLDMNGAFKVMTMQKQIAQLNDGLDKELKSLCGLLQSNDIKFYVVKGQTISSLYNNKDVRMPGDIDFYCDNENFQKASEVIKRQWNVDFEYDSESDQHRAFQHNDVPYEMHFRLLKLYNTNNQRYCDRLFNAENLSTVNVGDAAVPVLEPTIQVLYTFLHLYHHFVELGVGLRQFCDMAVLLHSYNKQIDREALRRHLKEIDFTHAFAAICWVLVDKLGLPEEDVPLPITDKDKSFEQHILDVVFKGGNFGKYARKHAVRSGMKYYLESIYCKAYSYIKFWSLSPKENCSCLLKEIPTKVLAAMKRKKKDDLF